ncbi:hypothetical protein DCAR_0207943 [Daucus carota subsp. sativus]|nr:PREDICTED: anther-specific protein BCP1-like [Daucus carota subsp. sativus]WOG88708.1 hypothetical protein DCAR_0207943 [Daucus carota subsp. sativus]
MASRKILVLALACFAIISMASAAQPAAPAEAPSDDIGTTDGNDDAAPVGAPVPDGAFSQSSGESPSGSADSGAASGLQLSTTAAFLASAACAAAFF